MKTSTKRVIAAAALMAVTLCASSTSAQRGGGRANREGRHFYRLSEIMDFDGFDVERRGGEILGVSVLERDGSWQPLRQQTSPRCPASCPEGQTLSCWEDDKQQTGVCFCASGGGVTPAFLFRECSGLGAEVSAK